jgi:Lrp/AsnC family leucine-responsive transcriptional regulator
MVELDETDLEILRMLHADARRAYSDIGESVDLSGPAVSSRVDRLRDHGVLQGFTVDLDRSTLVGGTTVLLEFTPSPTRTEAVADAVAGADGTEQVYATADGEVIAVVRVTDSGVREWVGAVLETVPDYRVRLIESETRGADLPVAGFDIDCAECGNRVTAEGTSAEIGDERRHFCCPSCESRFRERYEDLAAGT